MIGSITKNRIAVHTSIDQPGSTATAKVKGNAAAINDSIHGTKRRTAARMPHNAALGTPMIQSTIPIRTPKLEFISWFRNKRLSRAAASSRAAVGALQVVRAS